MLCLPLPWHLRLNRRMLQQRAVAIAAVSRVKGQRQIPLYSGPRAVQAGIGDNLIKKQEAIILSMTVAERRNPEIIKASRKKRIAAGSGVEVHDVNKLLKQYQQMALMMKKMGKGGGLSGLGSMMKNNPFGKFPGGMGNRFPF